MGEAERFKTQAEHCSDDMKSKEASNEPAQSLPANLALPPTTDAARRSSAAPSETSEKPHTRGNYAAHRLRDSISAMGASFRDSFHSSQCSTKSLLSNLHKTTNSKTSVPRKLLLNYLESTAISRDMCKHLPIVMFACVAFFMAVLNHVDVQRMSL
eukprot:759471-Hanusia_phi.AAC.1